MIFNEPTNSSHPIALHLHQRTIFPQKRPIFQHNTHRISWAVHYTRTFVRWGCHDSKASQVARRLGWKNPTKIGLFSKRGLAVYCREPANCCHPTWGLQTRSVAVFCSVLQCVAVCCSVCSVLKCVANAKCHFMSRLLTSSHATCNTPPQIESHCKTLQRTAAHCNIL